MIGVIKNSSLVLTILLLVACSSESNNDDFQEDDPKVQLQVAQMLHLLDEESVINIYKF